MTTASFRLEAVSSSETGRVREFNEDASAVDSVCGIAAVADGMGGHRAGDVASRMVIETLLARLRSKAGRLPAETSKSALLEFAGKVVAEANGAVRSAARAQSGCSGMGATLALLLFHGQQVALAHVGDSRIYRLRDGRLQLLTRDDSLVHDQVELGLITGADAADSHNRHLVTQALGMNETVKVHLRGEQLCSGDVFLLCTDGLSDLVDQEDIELIVDSLKTNLNVAASHLAQLANDNGGYDNIALALVRVLADEPVARPTNWIRRLFGWLAPRKTESGPWQS